LIRSKKANFYSLWGKMQRMYQGIDAIIGKISYRADSAHRTISHPHETTGAKQPAVCPAWPLENL